MAIKRAASPKRVPGRRKGSQAKLTTSDLVVLSLLLERPMHGYELVREYQRQEVEDWASVSRPHVYYSLQKLAEHGLIAGTEQHSGDRERMVYRVRPGGVKELAEALADPSWAVSAPPTPFRTWMGLSLHAPPKDAKRMISARREFLVSEIERERVTLEQLRAFGSPRARLGEAMVDLVLRQYETELAWLDERFPA